MTPFKPKTLREIDAKVAEVVLGWVCDETLIVSTKLKTAPSVRMRPSLEEWAEEQRHPQISAIAVDCTNIGQACNEHCPKYSIDIAAAWEVVEQTNKFMNSKLYQGDGRGLRIHQHEDFKTKQIFWCVDADSPCADCDFFWYKRALSAPLAICLAALKAKGIEVDMSECEV